MLDYIKYIRFYKGLSCPDCGSSNSVRFGKLKGKQRYRCKKCGRTFMELTSTPLFMTHFLGRWPLYLKCMLKGFSLRKSAKIVGVSYVSLFYWRHKLLSALKKIKTGEMKGIVEADDFFLPYSEKGSKDIYEKRPRYRKYQHYFIDERVYVFAASDSYGNLVSASFKNALRKENIEETIGKLISKGTIFCTNRESEYAAFSGYRHLKQYRMPFKNKEKFNNDRIREYLKNFQQWMIRFHGVASKYLNNYLSWHKFLYRNDFDAGKAAMKKMIEDVSLENI